MIRHGPLTFCVCYVFCIMIFRCHEVGRSPALVFLIRPQSTVLPAAETADLLACSLMKQHKYEGNDDQKSQ